MKARKGGSKSAARKKHPRGHLVKPHKGSAFCKKCNTWHTLPEHWSHTSGGHSGVESASYKKKRKPAKKKAAKKKATKSGSARKRKTTAKRSAPKRAKKSVRHHAPSSTKARRKTRRKATKRKASTKRKAASKHKATSAASKRKATSKRKTTNRAYPHGPKTRKAAPSSRTVRKATPKKRHHKRDAAPNTIRTRADAFAALELERLKKRIGPKTERGFAHTIPSPTLVARYH